jgi:predicted O-linked N-acetylglucosamine transferase (SPINDLY family)
MRSPHAAKPSTSIPTWPNRIAFAPRLPRQQLAAQTPQELVHVAANPAVDLYRLKALRDSLRQRMERSPLMDAPRFTQNIEAAYRQMWHTWCNNAIDQNH